MATDTTGTGSLAITSFGGDFRFGTVKRNRRQGTATLSVDVPDPGTLRLSGKARPVVERVRAAGTVRLRVRARGRGKRTLDRTGRLKLAARVTYTAAGASPLTKVRPVRLLEQP